MTDRFPPPRPSAEGWRTFLWLWGSQALSALGSIVSGFAISVYLVQTRFALPEQRGELAAALTLTLLAWNIITIFGAPLAGVLADRLDRRRILLTANVLGAALMALGVGMVTAPTPPLWLIVAFTAAEAALFAVHSAAFDTSYSTLVPREQLPRANGMMQALTSTATLIGPGLGALIIGLPALIRQGGGPAWLAGWTDGVALTLMVDALSFVVAALVLWRLHVPTPPRQGARTGLTHDLTYGWTFIVARPALLNLLLTFTVFNLLTVGSVVLRPLLLTGTLAADLAVRAWTPSTALAALYTTLGLGSVVGGLIISAWGGLRERRTLGILIPLLVAGLAQALTGSTHSVLIASAGLVVYGLMTPSAAAHSMSIWQSQVPPEVQGRVFSVRRMLSQFTNPISTAAAGLAAAHLPAGDVLSWAGVAAAVICGAQLLNPAVRRLDGPVPSTHPEPTTG
ncbi:MFS transporter [uncultured Deinococcus sp.]|uniref:MFS transporter n=1 Tax=uncultured Deinococcus sp. TaxID=158789 RepID=UPI0025DAC171|nr:MFS transporter [uncultured Deinococcus sp.]